MSMDFEVEDDSGEYTPYGLDSQRSRSTNNRQKHSLFGGKATYEAQDDDYMFDFDVDENTRGNANHSPISAFSPRPENKKGAPAPQPARTQTSDLGQVSALDRAKEMLQRYSTKTAPIAPSSLSAGSRPNKFKSGKANLSFDEEDISVDGESESREDEYGDLSLSSPGLAVKQKVNPPAPTSKSAPPTNTAQTAQPQQTSANRSQPPAKASTVAKPAIRKQLEESQSMEASIPEVSEEVEEIEEEDEESGDEEDDEDYSEEFDNAEEGEEDEDDHRRRRDSDEENASYSRMVYGPEEESVAASDESQEDSKPKILSFADLAEMTGWVPPTATSINNTSAVSASVPVVAASTTVNVPRPSEELSGGRGLVHSAARAILSAPSPEETERDIQPVQQSRVTNQPTVRSSQRESEQQAVREKNPQHTVHTSVASFVPPQPVAAPPATIPTSFTATHTVPSVVPPTVRADQAHPSPMGYATASIQSAPPVEHRVAWPPELSPPNVSNIPRPATVPESAYPLYGAPPPASYGHPPPYPHYPPPHYGGAPHPYGYPPYPYPPYYPPPPYYGYQSTTTGMSSSHPFFPPLPPPIGVSASFPPPVQPLPAASESETSQRVILELLREVTKAKEEAEWSRQKLAEAMMLLRQPHSGAAPPAQPTQSAQVDPQTARSQRQLEESEEYSMDFDVSQLQQSMHADNADRDEPPVPPLKQTDTSPHHPQASQERNVRFSDPEIQGLAQETGLVTPPVPTMANDPLAESIAKTFLASQELLRSKFDALRMKLQMTSSMSQGFRDFDTLLASQQSVSRSVPSLSDMQQSFNRKKEEDARRLFKLLRDTHPELSPDEILQLASKFK